MLIAPLGVDACRSGSLGRILGPSQIHPFAEDFHPPLYVPQFERVRALDQLYACGRVSLAEASTAARLPQTLQSHFQRRFIIWVSDG
eukprot:334602-Pleurochrysis_carterae.AAC.3